MPPLLAPGASLERLSFAFFNTSFHLAPLDRSRYGAIMQQVVSRQYKYAVRCTPEQRFPSAFFCLAVVASLLCFFLLFQIT